MKGLAQPLICNRFKKMVDVHSRNIGSRNKLDMASFRFTAGQLPWAARLWNDFAESSGNKENLDQLKAEVKKRHFLISFFFLPIQCKFHILLSRKIAILKLTEKPFYGVGWWIITVTKYFTSIWLLNNGFLYIKSFRHFN